MLHLHAEAREMAQAEGVQFRWVSQSGVCGREGDRIRACRPGRPARRRQLCGALGSYSPAVAQAAGMTCPLSVKGYSITCRGRVQPTRPNRPSMARRTGRRDSLATASGKADPRTGRYSLKLREARRDTLNHVVTDLFPRGGDVRPATSGPAAAMTPDGTPVLAPSPRRAGCPQATAHGIGPWPAGSGQLLCGLDGGGPWRST